MDFLYAETTIVASISFVLMLIAYKLSRFRKFHISVMISCIIVDISMPFYLYLNRDWYGRLIEGGEILNTLLWMHIGLVITVYVLYVMQLSEGRRLLKGVGDRENHHAQANGLILARGLMIFCGALLYEKTEVIETVALINNM